MMTWEEFDARLEAIEEEYAARKKRIAEEALAKLGDDVPRNEDGVPKSASELMSLLDHMGNPDRRRAEQRLEARKDRRCAHCAETFTPKNALGKTCSLRCQVAMHRAGCGKPKRGRQGRR